MVRYVTSALAGAALLGMSTAALAGEYDDMCAMGLAVGKEVKTDCSITAEIGGSTYCFGNAQAKAEFMKDPEGNLAKAQATYSKRNPG